jgi:hypothetical protein
MVELIATNGRPPARRPDQLRGLFVVVEDFWLRNNLYATIEAVSRNPMPQMRFT